MPHRYFHLQNGVTTLDHDGVDLPAAELRIEAVRTIGCILREDTLDSLWEGKPLRLWVTDGPNGTGKTLLALRLDVEREGR